MGKEIALADTLALAVASRSISQRASRIISGNPQAAVGVQRALDLFRSDFDERAGHVVVATWSLDDSTSLIERAVVEILCDAVNRGIDAYRLRKIMNTLITVLTMKFAKPLVAGVALSELDSPAVPLEKYARRVGGMTPLRDALITGVGYNIARARLLPVKSSSYFTLCTDGEDTGSQASVEETRTVVVDASAAGHIIQALIVGDLAECRKQLRLLGILDENIHSATSIQAVSARLVAISQGNASAAIEAARR